MKSEMSSAVELTNVSILVRNTRWVSGGPNCVISLLYHIFIKKCHRFLRYWPGFEKTWGGRRVSPNLSCCRCSNHEISGCIRFLTDTQTLDSIFFRTYTGFVREKIHSNAGAYCPGRRKQQWRSRCHMQVTHAKVMHVKSGAVPQL